MLVLSRRQDEKIIIGEGDNQITILVISLQNDKVRIGIQAPPHITIHREEVVRAIERERAANRPVQPKGPQV